MSVVAQSTAKDTRARLPISELRVSTVVAPLVLAAVVLGVWEVLVSGIDIDLGSKVLTIGRVIDPYIVPAPSSIWDQITANHASIVDGARNTGRNALIGMIGGALVGVLGAVLSSAVRMVDEMSVPVVAAASVVPIVALAPVLYTLFGAAVDTGRILVAGLSVSVPVYLNTLRGLRQVSAVHRELMTSYAAGGWQVARTVTLPTATPYIFTGLRIASSLAVISALIAEYFGGPIGGLGKSITSAASSSNYPLAYAYVFGAVCLGLVFYVATLLVELWFSRHHQPA